MYLKLTRKNSRVLNTLIHEWLVHPNYWGLIMVKRTIVTGFLVLMALSFVNFQIGYSQDNEAVYWFKKGVDEKNHDKKVEYYLKAIESKPNFTEAHYNLALAYLMQKKYSNAEDAFKKSLYVNPTALNSGLKSNILNRLGSMYRKMGRYKDAEESLQAALNISTDKQFRALTLYELGQAKIAQSQFDEAIRIFNQGMDISPSDRASFQTGIQLAEDQKNIYNLYQQGMQSVQANKLTEATDLFNKVLELDPSHQQAKAELQKMAAAQQQKETADSDKLLVLYNQAIAQMDKGEWVAAIKDFEDINQLQQNYKDVNKLLLQAKEKQYQELITDQLYEKGLENVQKGNYVLALINFERVAEINPNYKDISSVLATTRKKAEQNKDRAEAQMTSIETQSTNREANSPSNSNDRETTPGATQRTFEQSLSQRNTQLSMNIDSQLVRNFYKEALDLIQKEEWLQAGVVLEKVKLIEPNYQNTEFLLDQVKQNLTMSSVMNAKGKFAAESKSRNSGFILFGFLAGAVMLPVGLLLLSPTTRARYYILLKKYDKAREIYEGMLTKKPHNIKLYITLANIYINERRIDEVAIRIFERAIQYNDNLKIQLEPIVNRYYLEKSKTSDNPIHLLDEKLREHLRKMGN